MVVGGEYTATSVTKITNATNDSAVLHGISESGTGLLGESNSGPGVEGGSSSGPGLVGGSGLGPGVSGYTGNTSRAPGVAGQSWGWRTGVLGYSGEGPLPTAPKATGVYGFAGEAVVTRGVTGRSMAGRGVNGIATTGHGVHGLATTGIAGHFSTTNPKAGYALQAIGRVKLDKCAGVATIAAGSKSVVVTPGINLVAGSAVVATLQGSAGGTTTVHRCAVNAATDKFTIYLTANSIAAVRVAWIVLG
jgi:hypothetical protein